MSLAGQGGICVSSGRSPFISPYPDAPPARLLVLLRTSGSMSWIRGRLRLHRGVVSGAGDVVGIAVGVVHRPRSLSLSDSSGWKPPKWLIRPGGPLPRSRRTKGGRSHGGPGHGVALPAAGGGWALDAGRRKAAPRACFPEKLCANAMSKELANPSFSDGHSVGKTQGTQAGPTPCLLYTSPSPRD